MNRRTFIVGAGSTVLGGSALVGSGAFSSVESQRAVSIEVATDESAYLGLKPLDTPNSNNYVALDDEGHLTIDIAEHDDFDGPETQPGTGVNSDSRTYFDGMFELCNQGKEGACLSYSLPDGVVANAVDAQTVAFYYVERDSDGMVTNRRVVQEGEELLLELGDCTEMGVRTVTEGVSADDGPLIEDEVVVTADVDGDCFGDGSGELTELAVPVELRTEKALEDDESVVAAVDPSPINGGGSLQNPVPKDVSLTGQQPESTAVFTVVADQQPVDYEIAVDVDDEPAGQPAAVISGDGQQADVPPDADSVVANPVEIDVALSLPTNADPETELEAQFDQLTGETFGTNAVEICVTSDGTDGATELGVQVTDHHGTFGQTPTTWNPSSSDLASLPVEFENGMACFHRRQPRCSARRPDATLFRWRAGNSRRYREHRRRCRRG
jgi:hypothetical protein